MTPNPVNLARGAARRARRAAQVLLAPVGGPAVPEATGEYAANFDQWLGRRSDKLFHDGRPQWQPTPRVEGETPRIAVVIHAHFPELLEPLIAELDALPVPFDLVITNSSGTEISLPEVPVRNLRAHRILTVDNHGRDIFPLVQVVNAGLLDGYDLVLKLHTKKSEWRQDHDALAGSGAEWRDALVGSLVGGEDNVLEQLRRFGADRTLGIVTAPGSIAGPEHWGGDQQITRDLLRRLELPIDPGGLRFAAGSMYWIRGFLLTGLRSLQLTADDFEAEAGQIDGTTAHGIERLLGIVCEEAGFRLDDTSAAAPEFEREDDWRRFLPDAPRSPRARVLPFYLPQFHAFPENDAWWGPGFTEWANVASAKPVFHGHRQPFLPGEMGFYDLRNPEVQQRQFELARGAGIEGFMYYYYWFAGKKLMDLPVEQIVAGDGDTPFCLMWANENWTRRWDGSEKNILIAQDYDQVPATQFIHDVMHLITDPRYVRIGDKPVISVYRITQIPDFESVLTYWREQAVEAGLPGLHILTVDVGTSMQGLDVDDLGEHGLDGTMEFPPHNKLWVGQDQSILYPDQRLQGGIYDYRALAQHAATSTLNHLSADRFPGVFVNFDNTARRQWQPDLWFGSNPYTFRRWLNATVLALETRPMDERVLFINAWNEWAEGATLEPSQRFGRGYLHAVSDVLYA
ncbi:glycoside hydrolase family 99-like domain-containing protein [Mycetocola sp. JXN-3]|uniref:glycoside hydrolase family 99-like domain-containing protein n=1 Tax=Mycetocola sp. JXN-3 TaxID=2116510 RepID=UPI00165D1073|nr:glycoside hydrolase family 99-like domain-containing protein [Mycetocola sp. JXN-3]